MKTLLKRRLFFDGLVDRKYLEPMFAENDAGRKLESRPFTIGLEVEVNIHIFLRLHLVSPQQNIDERILKSGEVVVLILVKR